MNDTGIIFVHCLSEFIPVFSKHSLIRRHFRECYRIWQAVWHGLKWLHQQKWHWWSRGCFQIRIMTGLIIFHDYPWRFTSGILLRGSKHVRLTACTLKLSSKLPNIELSFLHTCQSYRKISWLTICFDMCSTVLFRLKLLLCTNIYKCMSKTPHVLGNHRIIIKITYRCNNFEFGHIGRAKHQDVWRRHQ